MPKTSRNSSKKTPKNAARRTASAGDDQQATQMVEEAIRKSAGKNPAAVALGRLGGLKGGHARARKLSAKERQEIARKAAQARWSANVKKK